MSKENEHETFDLNFMLKDGFPDIALELFDNVVNIDSKQFPGWLELTFVNND